MNIKSDFTGAMSKTLAVARIPQATRLQVERWGSETVKMMKLRVKDMKKSGAGTGHLWRNINFMVEGSQETWRALLGTGTGVGAMDNVKYASVQDKGAIIRAKKKYLTIPFPGVKGRASNYDCFPLKTPSGAMILFKATHNKAGTKTTLTPLFLLRRQVTVPGTGWFSTTLAIRKPALDAMMAPGAVFGVAQGMT